MPERHVVVGSPVVTIENGLPVAGVTGVRVTAGVPSVMKGVFPFNRNTAWLGAVELIARCPKSRIVSETVIAGGTPMPASVAETGLPLGPV